MLPVLAVLALQAVPVVQPAREKVTVSVHPAVMRQWSYMYQNFQGKEFLQCMYGRVERDTTVVPYQYEVGVIMAVNANLPPSELHDNGAGRRNESELATNWCPWQFQTWPLLGLAHSHLKLAGERVCMVSAEDYTLQIDRRYFLNLVICDDDRFIVYTQFTGLTGMLCRYDPEAVQPDCLGSPSEQRQ